MNGVPISICSITQKFMMLSVTEVKIAAGVIVAQDMLCVYHLMESLELEFELPTVLNMDNSSAVDIPNSWSVGGRTHQVDVHNYVLCELQDQGLLKIKYIAGEKNHADMSEIYDRHVPLYMGIDNYVSNQGSSGEVVSD